MVSSYQHNLSISMTNECGSVLKVKSEVYHWCVFAGQFYVMMSPQDVLQGQRNIAPRNTFQPKMEGGRTSRDDRRRATHNEGTLCLIVYILGMFFRLTSGALTLNSG